MGIAIANATKTVIIRGGKTNHPTMVNRRPTLLDLFCGQGGAAAGYARAGFDVHGVDIAPQPRYPHPFTQAEALQYAIEHAHEYDVIHASPPCQAYSPITMNKDGHERLIPATRDVLDSIRENVRNRKRRKGAKRATPTHANMRHRSRATRAQASPFRS
jgi:hypothetical protein